jgi:hypothetical protein
LIDFYLPTLLNIGKNVLKRAALGSQVILLGKNIFVCIKISWKKVKKINISKDLFLLSVAYVSSFALFQQTRIYLWLRFWLEHAKVWWQPAWIWWNLSQNQGQNQWQELTCAFLEFLVHREQLQALISTSLSLMEMKTSTKDESSGVNEWPLQLIEVELILLSVAYVSSNCSTNKDLLTTTFLNMLKFHGSQPEPDENIAKNRKQNQRHQQMWNFFIPSVSYVSSFETCSTNKDLFTTTVLIGTCLSSVAVRLMKMKPQIKNNINNLNKGNWNGNATMVDWNWFSFQFLMSALLKHVP